MVSGAAVMFLWMSGSPSHPIPSPPSPAQHALLPAPDAPAPPLSPDTLLISPLNASSLLPLITSSPRSLPQQPVRVRSV